MRFLSKSCDGIWSHDSTKCYTILESWDQMPSHGFDKNLIWRFFFSIQFGFAKMVFAVPKCRKTCTGKKIDLLHFNSPQSHILFVDHFGRPCSTLLVATNSRQTTTLAHIGRGFYRKKLHSTTPSLRELRSDHLLVVPHDSPRWWAHGRAVARHQSSGGTQHLGAGDDWGCPAGGREESSVRFTIIEGCFV